MTAQYAAPEIKICWGCASRLPGAEKFEMSPLLLTSGAIAHQSFRYKTRNEIQSGSDSTGCAQVGSISVGTFHLSVWSLLKPVCSAVDVVGYRPGSGDAGAPGETPDIGYGLELSADRSTYYFGESFYLRTAPKPAENGAKPVLLMSQRLPTGYPDGKFLEISPGCPGLNVLGQDTFQILQLDGRAANGEVHFLRSPALKAGNWR